MKTFLLSLLLILPCTVFAQKEANISRNRIFEDKEQSIVLPPIFPEFTSDMKLYVAIVTNGGTPVLVDLPQAIRKQAELTTDSTQADRVILFCLNNVSKPAIPTKYISFENNAKVKQFCLEYTPVISINVRIKDTRLGIDKNFIITNGELMTFYCGIDKYGIPTLTNLESLKQGENVHGASSPESFDYILDNLAQGIHRELMVKDIQNIIRKKLDTDRNAAINTLYRPRIISSDSFRMHFLGNKKAIAMYPEIDVFNMQTKNLFLKWAENPNDELVKSQLIQASGKYQDLATKGLGKNVSLMCYSNAALAMALCGDHSASSALEHKAQEYYRPFGVTVGLVISSVNKYNALIDRIKTQDTLVGL